MDKGTGASTSRRAAADPAASPPFASANCSTFSTFVVLVSTGSFNPPTYMHLRMFELAKDALQSEGYVVLRGYMSPVNDAYKKKGLLSAEHRIQMCELACKSSSFVMVDPWEGHQSSYERTLTVLSRVQGSLCNSGMINKESLKVMLLCGSDLLQSFTIPGAWIPDQGVLLVWWFLHFRTLQFCSKTA